MFDTLHNVSCTLQKNCGILALIDEESRFPKGTDKTLVSKLHHTHSGKAGNLYRAPPDGGMQFEITHFAGDVRHFYVLLNGFCCLYCAKCIYICTCVPGFV